MFPATVLSSPQDVADLVTPGVLGFLVIFAIAAALYFLLKNMRKQLGRIDFEEKNDEPAP
jgi:hypothetical protein